MAEALRACCPLREDFGVQVFEDFGVQVLEDFGVQVFEDFGVQVFGVQVREGSGVQVFATLTLVRCSNRCASPHYTRPNR